MSKLTGKQELFCLEYLVDLNATQAATAAGIEYTTKIPRGFYVYALACPIRNDVFYVGKGSGDRMLMHFKERSRINERKHARLDIIRASGLNVRYLVLADRLGEAEAYELEREFIAALPGLTNIADGGTATLREPYLSPAAKWVRLRQGAMAEENRDLINGGLTTSEVKQLAEDYLYMEPWNIKLPPDRSIAEILKRYAR
jgi:Terminase small subunit